MRAVVTGGCGFIGSHVVDLLSYQGDEILIIDKQLNRDIRAPLGSIIEFDPDVIFHLAAQTDVPTSVRDPLEDAETNILGTLNVLGAAEKCDAKVVFSSSAAAICGEPQSPYAISKLAAESYVRLAAPEHCVLRYANVYGPRQLATAEGGVVAIFADALREGNPPIVYGDGMQTRDFVHVTDVAQATVAAADWSGVLNVGTGHETTINELLLAMVKIGDYGDIVVADHPERDGDIRFSSVDPTRLADTFDWDPIPLHDGLASLLSPAIAA